MSKHYHKHGQAPHEEFIGALIGFIVVRIIMHALFYGQWWALIPIVATFFHMVKEGLNYLNDKEARQNYQYHTTSDDLFGMWVGFIIINIIMNAIFHGIWIGVMVSSILLIKAIETTVMYIKTQKQSPELTQHHEAPAIRVVVSEEQEYAMPASEENPKFCAMCGEHHGAGEKYCAACGNALNAAL